jgi:phosphatidylserine synthase
LKHIHINHDYASVLIIGLLLLIAALMTYTWVMLTLLGLGYLLSIPVSIVAFLKMKKGFLK